MEQYIIPALAAVVVAVIEAVAARERRNVKKDKADAERLAAAEKAHREEQEEAREQLLLLLIHSTNAAIALGEATGHAMQRGHTNGDMEKALEYAATVKHEQKEFLSKRGVHTLWD